MRDTGRFIVVVMLVLTGAALRPLVASAQSGRTAQVREGHTGDCGTMTGITQARCEWHEGMYEKCHAIRGEARHECDQPFILANQLDCSALTGARCAQGEIATDKRTVCSSQPATPFFADGQPARHED